MSAVNLRIYDCRVPDRPMTNRRMPISHTHRGVTRRRVQMDTYCRPKISKSIRGPTAGALIGGVRGHKFPGMVFVVNFLVALPLIVALAGCELGYYWQAAGGQMEILSRRRPIDEVLADGGVDDTVKAKLRVVLKVQDFGVEQLGMPGEDRYTLYADLGRPAVSWLVVASQPWAFEAVEQCYLIVGCLDYVARATWGA